MDVIDTLIPAVAALAGASIGAWATALSGRRVDLEAARSELASAEALIWMDWHDRRTGLTTLRYRLLAVGLRARDIEELMGALNDCIRQLDQARRAFDDGLIDGEDVGLLSTEIEPVTAAADALALKISTRRSVILAWWRAR